MRRKLQIGPEGELTIPADTIRQLGLEPGSWIVIENGEEGQITLRRHSAEAEHQALVRKALFLLQNASDEDDFCKAEEIVRQMGLDPGAVFSDSQWG